MRKFKILVLLLALVSSAAFAQKKTITGIVTEASNGEPLPGVSVVVKGTTIGTVTNLEGAYSIQVDANAKALVYSFIGMNTEERVIASDVINIALKSDSKEVDEVTVIATGYGKVEKAGFTGSASVVSEDAMKNAPVPSFQRALQGNAAGVQVSGSTGQPGGGSSIRIRGVGSVNASSEPLYVIDGIPVISQGFGQLSPSDDNSQTTNILSSINPDDIDNVTILKDASAVSIYGARAANGVVLITTKMGKKGASRVNVSFDTGLSTLPLGRKYDLASSAEIHKLYYDAYKAQGQTSAQAANSASSILNSNPYNMTNPYDADGNLVEGAQLMLNTDWMDQIFQIGTYQKYSVDFSGGTDNTTYYTSIGYYSQDGVVIGSDFERISAKFNLSSKINDKLKFGTNTTLSYSDQNQTAGGTSGASPMRNGLYYNSAVPVYEIDRVGTNADGSIDRTSGVKTDENGNVVYLLDANGEKQYNYTNPVSVDFNPHYSRAKDIYNTKTYKVLSDVYVEWDIAEGLKFRPSVSIDYTNLDEMQYYNPYHGNAAGVGGRTYKFATWNVLWKNTNSLFYTKTVNEKHNFDAMASYEIIENNYNTMFAHGTGFPDFGDDNLLPELDNASQPQDASSRSERWALISYIGRLNYNFDRKYYFTGTFRRDGSSRFGANNRYANFWSVGASWSVKSESFLQDVAWIDNLKLRTSYGTSGNDQVGVWDYKGLYSGDFTYNGNAGYINNNVANPDLTWEESTNFNVAIDYNIFRKLRGSLEYYNKVTDNLLFSIPLSASNGGSIESSVENPSYKGNFGKMKNSGVEFELTYSAVQKKDLNIDFNFNIATNKNELLKLPTEENIQGSKIWRVGTDVYQFYLQDWAGVAQAGETLYGGTTANGGEATWYIDVEQADGSVVKEKTSNYSAATRYEVGSALPDFFGGFGTNVNWKGINFNVLFSYGVGGNVLDYTKMDLFSSDGTQVSRQALDHYGNNPNSKNSTFTPNNADNSNSRSTRFLYDASYLRLRNLSVSYTLPKHLLGDKFFKSASISFAAENLWAHFFDPDFDGFDTEMGGVSGTITQEIPNPTTYSMGLKFGF